MARTRYLRKPPPPEEDTPDGETAGVDDGVVGEERKVNDKDGDNGDDGDDGNDDDDDGDDKDKDGDKGANDDEATEDENEDDADDDDVEMHQTIKNILEPPSVDPRAVKAMMMAMTKAMTTAITNASLAAANKRDKPVYSTALDPYDDESFETTTKEGKYRWHLVTKTTEGWKKESTSATVDHADKVLDLFKDRAVQFGLDNIMNVPTSGTGKVENNPRLILGKDQWNAELGTYINVLTSYHQLTLDQVRAFSGWFMGDESSKLETSSTMKVEPIYPNIQGNIGLVNRYKIRLRQLSGALHFILKNHISRKSYNSF